MVSLVLLTWYGYMIIWRTKRKSSMSEIFTLWLCYEMLFWKILLDTISIFVTLWKTRSLELFIVVGWVLTKEAHLERWVNINIIWKNPSFIFNSWDLLMISSASRESLKNYAHAGGSTLKGIWRDILAINLSSSSSCNYSNYVVMGFRDFLIELSIMHLTHLHLKPQPLHSARRCNKGRRVLK